MAREECFFSASTLDNFFFFFIARQCTYARIARHVQSRNMALIAKPHKCMMRVHVYVHVFTFVHAWFDVMRMPKKSSIPTNFAAVLSHARGGKYMKKIRSLWQPKTGLIWERLSLSHFFGSRGFSRRNAPPSRFITEGAPFLPFQYCCR